MFFYFTLFFGILAIICSLCVITVKNPVHAILYLILVFCNISFILVIWNVEFVAIIFLIVYVGAIAVLFLFVVMMLNIKIIELNEVFWRYLPVGLLISSIFILELFYLLSNYNFHFISFFRLLFDYFLYYKNFVFFSLDIFPYLSLPTLSNIPVDTLKGHGLFLFYGDAFISSASCPTSSFFFYGFFLSNDFYLLNDYYYWLFTNEIKSNTETLGWFIYTYGFFLFFIISLILLLAMIGSIVLILNQNINVKRQLIFQQVARNFTNSVRLVS